MSWTSLRPAAAARNAGSPAGTEPVKLPLSENSTSPLKLRRRRCETVPLKMARSVADWRRPRSALVSPTDRSAPRSAGAMAICSMTADWARPQSRLNSVPALLSPRTATPPITLIGMRLARTYNANSLEPCRRRLRLVMLSLRARVRAGTPDTRADAGCVSQTPGSVELVAYDAPESSMPREQERCCGFAVLGDSPARLTKCAQRPRLETGASTP